MRPVPLNCYAVEATIHHHRLDEDRAVALRNVHAAEVDIDQDGVIYYANARNFPDWMRRLEVERPHLLGRELPETSIKSKYD